MKRIVVLNVVLIVFFTSCFMFEKVEIHTAIDGAGLVTRTPQTDEMLKGETITFMATAANGWTFMGWSGDIESRDNPLTVRVNQNINVTAQFAENISMDFLTTGEGSILYSPVQETYPEGSVIQCAAVPKEGSYFSHWNDDTENPETNWQFTITKEEDTICAHFEKNLHYEISAQWNSFTQSTLEPPLDESPFVSAEGAFLSRMTMLQDADESRSLSVTDWEPAIIIKLAGGADGSSLVSDIESLAGEIETAFSEIGFSFQRIVFPDKTKEDLLEIIAHFMEFPEVLYTEIDDLVQAHTIPNDELYSYQWNFHQLNLAAVWDRFYSLSHDVVVAVIDTGVDFFLSDLTHTQFVSGYDFVSNDEYPIDDHGHGSHVIGTIAQSTNNTEGVAGFAYESKIMPVKVLNSEGSGTDSQVAQGIVWAVLNGADVINMSLGSSDLSQLIYDACKFAYDHGVVVIASSGNDNGPVGYPAAIDDYVYAVGSSDCDKERASYSNYGPELDIVAPGGNTDKTLHNEIFDEDYPAGILQQTLGGYTTFQGTSMAAPHVSALASLILKKNPNFSPDQVMEKISDSADDLGDSGFDNYFGNGLINPLRALDITSKYVSDDMRYSIIPREGVTQYWSFEIAEGSIDIHITYNGEDSILDMELLDSTGDLIISGVKYETGGVCMQADIIDNDEYYLKIVYEDLETE